MHRLGEIIIIIIVIYCRSCEYIPRACAKYVDVNSLVFFFFFWFTRVKNQTCGFQKRNRLTLFVRFRDLVLILMMMYTAQWPTTALTERFPALSLMRKGITMFAN